MSIYKLYVKTHNVTGLKYLGKTTAKDPHKYSGSGIYWRQHLEKHGYDYTTEIIKECFSNNEVRIWGSYYSKLWNVVESNKWANLKPETGDGVDSISAKKYATSHHANMTEEKKKVRSRNCSTGQLKRFKESPESIETKKKKSDSHKGTYRIESPDGRIWITDMGLKDFAETHKSELLISYWSLFNAYRKCYTNTVSNRNAKNINQWKVTRVDAKSDS